jgi:predicted nucleotide-binding protein
VVFELGWLCAKIGRNRVCVLKKRGTRVHSDLEGISYLEFVESVSEMELEILGELRAAGVVT